MKRIGSLWSLVVVAVVLIGTLVSMPGSHAATKKEEVLYDFHPGRYGRKPFSGVVMDGAGNLYGTTYEGGRKGCGVIYKLRGGAWTYTSLHDFAGGNDGCAPWGDLVMDEKGNLYGTTVRG